MEMIERMHSDRNRNRTRPCLQSRSDAFRILKYDIASAAEDSNHNQPLLLRRHNVIAGMFLVSEKRRQKFQYLALELDKFKYLSKQLEHNTFI